VLSLNVIYILIFVFSWQNEVVAAGHYRIPHGGAFSLVSAPNYFGELIEWTGYALAAWSPAGVAFVLFSLANLVPRAVSNHAWYKKTFGAAYPKQRRAVIPYLL
jgi:protein-S-isoprenylcysteine O-methyltransferase Ste14